MVTEIVSMSPPYLPQATRLCALGGVIKPPATVLGAELDELCEE